MKQTLFAIACLLVFGAIIALGEFYKEREVDTAFAEAQKRVDQFPDLPTVKPEVLIPQDLVDQELAKIQATEAEVKRQEEAAAAVARAEQEKLAAQAEAERQRIAAEIAAAKKQEELRAAVPSLSPSREEIDNIFSDAGDTVEAVQETATRASVAINDAARAVSAPDPIQMDEDGLPLKAEPVATAVNDVNATTLAMADRLGETIGAAEDVAEAVTGLRAEMPTMAAQTVGPQVLILAYHQFKNGSDWADSSHVTPVGVLKEHLAALEANGFEVVPLSQVVAALKGEAQLPPKAAVLTVDNGFNNALKVAAPVFKEKGLPWTFFVFTKLVSTGATGATWDELLVEIQDENFDVQSQTKSHLFLTRRKGRDKKHWGEFLDKELGGSREMIELRLNQPVYALAYPFGNYNEEIIEAAAGDGYQAMVTTEPMFVDMSKGPAALRTLPRYVVTKESAGYLESFLGDNALTPTAMSPPAGSVDKNPRPEITLTLAPSVKINPESVKGIINGVAETTASYDPSANAITLKPQSDLSERAVRIQVTAETPDGEPTGLSWYYYFEPELLPSE
ncbi:MAG: polysaccharide deacetylase family protein [Verrucomicrobiota bacterium]